MNIISVLSQQLSHSVEESLHVLTLLHDLNDILEVNFLVDQPLGPQDLLPLFFSNLLPELLTLHLHNCEHFSAIN